MGFSPNKSVLDLEMVIEGERRKGREVKEKIEYELDNERKTRIEFENKLIRAREELQKKDLLISELDFKANDFENENNSLRQENEGLKEELDRLNDYCEAHQRDLEEKLVMQSRKMMAMEQGFRDQVNLLKEQSLEELDRVTCDLENRNKILEEKLRGILNGKNQAEEEVKKLADLLKRSRMEAEEHIKEVVIRVQEDEYRKFMANMKALENKLRASEETRDLLGKKVQEQSKILNELSRKLEETEIDSQNNISRLKQDKSDMENQLRQADIMVSKYRNELSAKENLNSRMEAELIEMQKIIHQQKERSRGEVENVLKEVGNEKRYLEDQREQMQRKIQQLEAAIKQKDSDIGLIKADYDRLCNMLHNNITKTITQTIREKPYGANDKSKIGTQSPFVNKY